MTTETETAGEFRLRSSGSAGVAAKDLSSFEPINVEVQAKPSNPAKSATFIGNLRKSITLKRPKSSSKKPSDPVVRSRSANEADPVSVKVTDESESRSPSPSTASSNFFTRGVSNTFGLIWRSRGASERRVTKPPSTVDENTKPTQTKASVMNSSKAVKEAGIKFVAPNKFFIDNYQDVSNPVIFGDEQSVGMQHAVMISNCSNCAIKITRKVNKIEINNCKKVTFEIPAVISSVDVQNSVSCDLYVTERLPGASVDSCESLSIYLPRSSMPELSVASSGGGSATIYLPKENDQDELEEHQIPFQFVHKFEGGKLVSEVSPLYTH